MTVGLELIQATIDKIRVIQEQMRAAQSHQQSYTNQRRRPLEFQVGDQVFLRVFLTKGVVRFGIAGKLSLRYIESYPVILGIGK